MRVGAAQDLLNSGASMPIIMQRGRWSKTDTVMRFNKRYGNNKDVAAGIGRNTKQILSK
jgi:hypothetical protein